MRICLRIEMLFLCTMKIWLLLGGGVALLYATKALENLKTENEDQRRGIHIIQNALKVCFFFFSLPSFGQHISWFNNKYMLTDGVIG